MWPFNRRKKSDEASVPPEVQQYYESEHRERVGLAWLIAFLSLIVTVIVIVGLFFGGRWAYRKIAHKDNPVGTTQVATPNQSTSPLPNPTTAQKPASPKTGGSSSKPKSTSVSKPAQTSTSKQKTSVAKSTSSNKIVANNSKIVNTGPGDTLAIFVVTVLAGYMTHAIYSRRKLSKSL